MTPLSEILLEYLREHGAMAREGGFASTVNPYGKHRAPAQHAAWLDGWNNPKQHPAPTFFTLAPFRPERPYRATIASRHERPIVIHVAQRAQRTKPAEPPVWPGRHGSGASERERRHSARRQAAEAIRVFVHQWRKQRRLVA